MPENITRRQVIKAAGGGALGAVVGSQAAGAQPDEERFIVGVEPGRADVARRRADEVYRVLDFGDIGQAVSGWFSEEALADLQNNPNVRYIEQDGTWHAIDHASDETLPWGIDRVDAEVVHHADDSETGAGSDIAIIDTGIDDDHPDLQANIADPSDDSNHEAWVNCRGPNCNYPWSDDHDHGTHCAGIADAVDNSEGVIGVSTEASLHALKVLDNNGSGSWSDIAAAIEYTADQGWDVGSMSLGGSSGSQTVKDAVVYADDRGVLLVAAAGNDGPCSDCVGYPAAYEEVVAVSATSCDDSLASFSSTGPEVELAAPGEDVYSTVIGGYDTFSGTSMACPHVSGAGGQLMANGYTNTEARDQLKSTAEDLGLDSNEQGAGLLDVAASLGLDSSDDGTGDGPNCSTNDDDNPPSVDNLSLDEVETDTENAEFDASWDVSDDDGDLDSVDLTLHELDSDGNRVEEEDSATEDASGDSASGTTRLVAAEDDGSGNTYEVEAVVSDSNSNTDSDTATETESEDDGGGGDDNSPVIDQFDLTDTSNPRWARVEIDWTVSDNDGDLAKVTSEATFANGGNSTETSSVSGSSASGTDELRERDGHGDADVTLTVTDSSDNTTSETKTITLG